MRGVAVEGFGTLNLPWIRVHDKARWLTSHNIFRLDCFINQDLGPAWLGSARLKLELLGPRGTWLACMHTYIHAGMLNTFKAY